MKAPRWKDRASPRYHSTGIHCLCTTLTYFLAETDGQGIHLAAFICSIYLKYCFTSGQPSFSAKTNALSTQAELPVTA